MHPLMSRLTTVLLSAALVVLGLELTAYAANGHALLLGGGNTESKPATLTNTGSGAALSLRSTSGSPPLAVSNTQKVARLNADAVDGLDGKALQTHATTFTIPAGPTSIYSLTGVKAGTYLAVLDITMASPNPVGSCGLAESVTTGWSSLAYAPELIGEVAVSASAVIVHPSGSTLYLNCSDQIAVGAFSDTVSLIPIGTQSAGTLGPAPVTLTVR